MTAVIGYHIILLVYLPLGLNFLHVGSTKSAFEKEDRLHIYLNSVKEIFHVISCRILSEP